MNENFLFSPETLNVGEIAVGQIGEGVFRRQAGGLSIRRIDVGCGCTTVRRTETEISVNISIGALPEGVTVQGLKSYAPVKHLTVVFEDNTFQTLYVTARVYDPR